MKFVPTTPLINPPTGIRLAGRRTCEVVGLVYKTDLFRSIRNIRNFSALEAKGFQIARLPFALRILLENLLRNEDGVSVPGASVTFAGT